jgi:SAM-dependent methyltransferase
VAEARAVWAGWAKRWDTFQNSFVPEREQQFAIICDYIRLVRPRDPVRVLDLCSGPGSFGGRLLRERPGTEVVAVDLDPWLIELGRRTAPGRDRIVWVEADLREEDWVDALPPGTFDAVVATTAMHWFKDEELERIYRALAGILAARGVLLTSDLVATGSDGVRSLARNAHARWQEASAATPPGEHWTSFWRDVAAEPAFAELLQERDRRFAGRHPERGRPTEFHERALFAAGFAEMGEVWRRHENAILLAIR